MKNKGFTYLELLLVLSIMILLASLVSVNASNIIGKHNVLAIAKQIQSSINYVQQKALEENDDWVIMFDDEDNICSYSIAKSENISSYNKVIISDKSVFWGDNNNDYYPPETITFNSLGAPVSNSLVFAINNKEGKQLYIKITAITGRVKIVSEIN